MIVLGAGTAPHPSRRSAAAILRPPHAPLLAARMRSTAASISCPVRAGELFGRREQSSSPARPEAAYRSSHLYPFER